jgi:hypothetical protein
MAKKILLSIAIGSLALSSLFLISVNAVDNSVDAAASDSARESIAKSASFHLSSNPKSTQLAVNPRDDRLDKLKNDFQSLWEMSRMPEKNSDRDQMLVTISADHASLDIARLIITDNNFARNRFGENQAEARILAIELLEKSALNGNMEPIRDAIHGLGQILSKQHSVNKGQARDMEDMIAAYTRIEADSFFFDGSRYMKELGCSQKLIDHCANGIYFGLSRKHKKSEILPLINAAIADISSTASNSSSSTEG